MGSNKSRHESRRILAERLRRFVHYLMTRFSTSSDELLRRAEAKQVEESRREDPNASSNERTGSDVVRADPPGARASRS